MQLSTYAAEDRVHAENKNLEPVEEQHTPGADSDSESNSLLRASIPTQETRIYRLKDQYKICQPSHQTIDKRTRSASNVFIF